jgi:glyoxylase-like metal-dependent hydrolase (beta-lactamase superfamily II)
VSVLDTAGHTPGHISLLLAGDDGLLIPADAVTEPYVYFPHPEWRFAYDMDSELAVANRRRLLERAATDRMKMLGFHWPYPGVGFAERKGTGYRYVPAA